MRTQHLAALVAALALSGAAPVGAYAEPAARAPVAATIATQARPTPVSDSERYQARQAQSQSAADFQGGAEGIVVIGTSTIVLAALIVLLVILL